MVRYLIKFQKTDLIKFLSHLDTMRTLYRAMKRANLPITYSKGFNPHPSISITSPLSVGIASLGEYADVEFDKELDEDFIKYSLNKNLPLGMKILDCIKVNSKMPSSMSIVEAARYEISLKCDLESLKNAVDKIKKQDNLFVLKRTKTGEKEVNIKPMIYDIKLRDDKGIKMEVVLQNSNKGSLNPELLLNTLRNYGVDIKEENITRIDMYVRKDKLIELDKFYKNNLGC
ncbi:radical SAM-linked protein [Caloramator fervidus]|uniref:Radical SAM-linked protein n=1 Tax=Caloramator fervidus TaxID=29344 RepID=A0A1H5VR99_9CLOT|nr:TIGR03936 family radical SAM-associated protein [Caloramator fervidus]SEF89536.1 radical SAM-linked protein [Caloramator fervidus]